MLIITNTGILHESWSKRETTPLDKGIHHYYSDSVIFSDDLTIGGFFNTLYKYKEIIEQDFISYTQCDNLQPFYDQLQQPIDQYTQLNHPTMIQKGIMLKYSASISTHTIEGEIRNYVNSWNQLVGIEKHVINMAVNLQHLNCIAHLPLKMDMKYNVHQINPFDKDVVLATNLIHHFTLHDIIATLFYELTFVDVYDCMEELKSVEDLIREDLIRTIKSKKYELEVAKNQELYEQCHLLQTEIIQLETELRSQQQTFS